MSLSLPVDAFHVRVLPSLAQLSKGVSLPHELREVLGTRPDHLAALQRWMGEGYVIELHTLKKTPDPLLQAIKRIARFTQENVLVPWLPRLLQEGDMPTFTAGEIRLAEREGVALYEEARFISTHRGIGKQMIGRDVARRGIREEHEQFLRELNNALLPHAIDELLYRVGQDHVSHEASVKTFAKALFIIGPLAHILEGWLPGVGKAWAILANPLWGEGKELRELHGAGLTSRQFLKRSHLSLLGVTLVTSLIYWGEKSSSVDNFTLAGLLFGLAVSAPPLLIALESLFRSYRAMVTLKETGKLRVHEQKLGYLALREHLLRAEHARVYLSLILAPCLSAITFTVFPESRQNGWALALIGIAYVGLGELMRLSRDKLRRGAWTEFRRRLFWKEGALDGGQEMR